MTLATELQAIYAGQISEVTARLGACEHFLDVQAEKKDLFHFEAALLQLRKAMESIAFASIAPNRAAYEKFRADAEEPADYRKDFNARAILRYLAKINVDFYPTPLLPPVRQADNTVHFGRRTEGALTKNQFETFYDRLGKLLHSDNPWGKDKGAKNLAEVLPNVIAGLRGLLAWHFTVIRSPQFYGVWVVEVPNDGRQPRVLTAQADGDFVVAPVGS